MTYEEFDKRCDELENAPLPERKTFFADVLAGETEKTDVRMMAFFRYALLFYREGDFLAAREILEPFIIDYKSYRYRPEIIACFNLVGVVAYYVQEYALSRFYIREGLKIAQEHSEVSRYAYEYNNLAVTYLAQQDYEKALEVIREAEKNMPVSDEVMHAYIYRNLAEICCHLDRLDEAKDALAKCVAYRGREILPEEVRIVNTLLTYKSGDTAGYKRCCAELRENLPQLHAQEFLASCKVLFDCGMDAGDNAQVEWVLDAMDAYLREKGACSVQMMRATAATRVSIDYQDETDFVRKMRAASLLTPFFALLSDNAPVYQASRNSSYCIRTRLWQDVDRDRCGVTPHLMDADFGYARYAENVLTKPQITALRLGRVRAAGGKIAPELYAGHVSRQETAQILSNFFYDVRLKSRIELRAADSMPPRYIAAYAQLVKSVFGSPAALQNVLRHYAGITTLDITTAKLAVCKDGFNALAYGKPISSELTWLLMQARSRTPSQEERALLDPFMQLLTTRKTIRETENYNE